MYLYIHRIQHIKCVLLYKTDQCTLLLPKVPAIFHLPTKPNHTYVSHINTHARMHVRTHAPHMHTHNTHMHTHAPTTTCVHLFIATCTKRTMRTPHRYT